MNVVVSCGAVGLCASVALWAAIASAGEGVAAPNQFDVGRLHVVMNTSGRNVAPVVSVSNRVIQLCSGVWGDLADRRRFVRFQSKPTMKWTAENTGDGMRVTFGRQLSTGSETNETLVGLSRTVILFSKDSRVRVETTVTPSEPGRYTLHDTEPFLQTFYLPVANWVGCEVVTQDARGNFRRAQFPSVESFDPNIWGLNTGRDGAKTIGLGFADFEMQLKSDACSDFRVNHYRSGFQCDSAFVNSDTMHKPAWTSPKTWSCEIFFN